MRYLLVRPGERFDYAFDWSDWLVEDETIVGYQWSIDPADGITLTGALGAVVYVDGFSAGQVYRLVCEVTTSIGVVAAAQMVLRCQ